MLKKQRWFYPLCAILTLLIFATGCASDFTTISALPAGNYEKLGTASGTGCGTLFIDGTAYNFIPVLLNSRVERAYAKALESVPEATGLIDVSYEEFWFWWVLGTTRCVSISGEAIR